MKTKKHMIFNIRSDTDKPRVIEYIHKLPDNKQYTVKVKTKRHVRSASQNSLYWMWLTCIQDETGNNKNDLHEYFRSEFCNKNRINLSQKTIEIPVSTTTLDTKQFTEYLNKIQVFATSELGIILPDPDDANWENFCETYNDRI